MRSCLMISVFILSFGIYNYGFCEINGKKELEKGVINLEMFKQLVKYELQAETIRDIRNKIKSIKDEERFSSFLEILVNQCSYKYPTDGKFYWDVIGSIFNEAKKKFEEAIKLEPTFVDAYLCKAIACVQMGDYEEALSTFEKVIGTTTNGNVEKCIDITPFWEIEIREYINCPFKEKKMYKTRYKTEIIQDLFYTMADEVMNRRLKPPQGITCDDWAKRAIEVFMNWREKYLKEKIETTEDEDEKAKLTKKRIENCFELVNFYIKHQKRNEANTEVKNAENNLKEKGKHAPAIINNLKNKIEDLQEIPFVMNEELVKEFRRNAEIRFWNDSDLFDCKYLHLSFLSSGCFIDFKHEGFYEYTGGTQSFFIKEQTNPTCEITLPQIEIKEENKVPFYLTKNNNVVTSPTSFELMFKEAPIRKYPRIGESYEWKRDENNEWTVIQTIRKEEGIPKYTEEKFEKGKKFTSNITMERFAAEKLEIKKGGKWGYIPQKAKDRTTWIVVLGFVLAILPIY